jgi:hypothetical protein
MNVKQRLEYLRGELRAERISYGELAELQSLAESIEPGDMELREAAGMPEEEIHERPCKPPSDVEVAETVNVLTRARFTDCAMIVRRLAIERELLKSRIRHLQTPNRED